MVSMANMMMRVVLHASVLFSYSDTLQILRTPPSVWKIGQVHDNCTRDKESCVLWTYNKNEMQQLLSSQILKVGETVWVGARYLRTLMWKSGSNLIEDDNGIFINVGCYAKKVNDNAATRKAYGVFNCYKECIDYYTMLLKDNTCQCLKTEIKSSSYIGSRDSDQDCNNVCSDNPYQCGGKEFYSAYRIMHRVKFKSDSRSQSCFYGQFEGGTLHIRHANCNDSKTVICTTLTGGRIGEVTETANFQEAIKRCSSVEGRMPSNKDNNTADTFAAGLYDNFHYLVQNRSFWLDLNLVNKAYWINNKPVTKMISTNLSEGCLAMKALSQTDVTFQARPCSDQLPLLCSCSDRFISVDMNAIKKTLTPLRSEDAMREEAIVAASIGFGVFIIFLIILLVLCYLKRSGKLRVPTASPVTGSRASRLTGEWDQKEQATRTWDRSTTVLDSEDVTYSTIGDPVPGSDSRGTKPIPNLQSLYAEPFDSKCLKALLPKSEDGLSNVANVPGNSSVLSETKPINKFHAKEKEGQVLLMDEVYVAEGHVYAEAIPSVDTEADVYTHTASSPDHSNKAKGEPTDVYDHLEQNTDLDHPDKPAMYVNVHPSALVEHKTAVSRSEAFSAFDTKNVKNPTEHDENGLVTLKGPLGDVYAEVKKDSNIQDMNDQPDKTNLLRSEGPLGDIYAEVDKPLK